MMLFKTTKRKLVITAGIFLVIVIFLPVFNCLEQVEVREKFCKEYDLCTVDKYFPLSLVIGGYDDGFYCPSQKLSTSRVVGVLLLFFLITYPVVCVGDYLYTKYRDV